MMLFLWLFTLAYFPHPTAAHSWPSNSTFRWDLITARSGMPCLHTTREQLVDYKEPGFLAVVWFGSFPLPSPLLPSASSTGDTGRLRKRDNFLTGWGRSQIIRPRESLVLCKTSILSSHYNSFYHLPSRFFSVDVSIMLLFAMLAITLQTACVQYVCYNYVVS